MEALSLLASLATTLFASTLHSLILLLRLLLRFPRRPSLPGGAAAAVRLYEGRVHHSRRLPASHAFEYSVRYAPVDLDCLPLPGHLSVADARRIASTSGAVHLLTIHKSVGYEQNPLSIYYCYDSAEQGEDGHLKTCIAEDMLGNWSIRADAPGDSLYVVISVQHPTLGNYFTPALHAKLVEKTSSSLRLATFFWLMPHKVAAGIYWEAIKLWLKNVKFLDHPRYQNNVSYRTEAQKRDLEIRSSCSFLQKQNMKDRRSTSADEIAEISNQHDHNGEESVEKRWCVWRDAQWPWL